MGRLHVNVNCLIYLLDSAGGSANALVWLLQCISRAPPHGAPGESAIQDWRRTVDRMVGPKVGQHLLFRRKVKEKSLHAAKSQLPGLFLTEFGLTRSI